MNTITVLQHTLMKFNNVIRSNIHLYEIMLIQNGRLAFLYARYFSAGLLLT